jgi:alcohol dehydrogenase, propanol-preferring
MEIPEKMRAMVLEMPQKPLRLMEMPVPKPASGQVLVQVQTCGVCRTDLHIIDGELPRPKPNLIPGHEIVGVVVQTGANAERFSIGDRIGIPWLGYTDGECPYCIKGQENLCDDPLFTGYSIDGGYAEYTVADQRYCFPIPKAYDAIQAAPLLCAGLIGYRSYRMVGETAKNIGLYGFGASAHIVIQTAKYEGKHIYAFTRPGDIETQEFARGFGADWAGDSTNLPPDGLDAAIIFAPVGELIPAALKAVTKGGTVICAGIHMSDIPSFPYRLLWEERVVRSVANLTRADGVELLAIAPKIPIRIEVQAFQFEEANKALDLLRNGQIHGAAVLKIK